jgi:hypothetical protein
MTQIVPFAVGAARSIKLLKHGTLKAYPGFSPWHADYQYGSDQP